MTKSDTEYYYELFKNDIYEFAKFFFPHLLYKGTPEFHKTIYSELPKHKFLAVEVFRGGAKSTLGLIVNPIHHALFKKIGTISLLSQSEAFIINEISRVIKKEFESNERILAFFGDQRTSKWAETFFVLKNGIAFEAGGISGQLRGGRRGLICLDDLEDEETANSEEQRDKLKRRINKELIPKLLPEAQMTYFGTFVSELCYLKQIFDIPNNGWHKIRFNAYKTDEEVDGNEQWKEMMSHKELQRIKSVMGSNYFYCEYMGNPTASGNVPIKDSQLRYWKDLPQTISGVITVDPAYSEEEGSDYKTASLIAIDEQGRRYLVSYIRTHEPTGIFQDSVINLWRVNRNFITAVGVPNSGIEKSFYESFWKKCEERKAIDIPLVDVKNSFTSSETNISIRNKTKRIIASLQPLFEQGRYFIHSDHMEAREEIITIGQSKHDDIVDTMAYAEQILQPVFNTVENTKEEGFTAVPANYGMDY